MQPDTVKRKVHWNTSITETRSSKRTRLANGRKVTKVSTPSGAAPKTMVELRPTAAAPAARKTKALRSKKAAATSGSPSAAKATTIFRHIHQRPEATAAPAPENTKAPGKKSRPVVPAKQEMTYANGRKYIGALCNGLRHGAGTLQNPDGTTFYKGMWANDEPHGEGALNASDGVIYEGHWVNGALHGQGVVRYPDGATYFGNWINGRPDGIGVRTLANGMNYRGEWAAGELHGQGTCTLATGDILEGSWRNHHPCNIVRITLAGSQKILEGQWYNDPEWGSGYILTNNGEKISFQYGDPNYLHETPKQKTEDLNSLLAAIEAERD